MNKTLLVGTQHINISWDDNHLNNLIESLFAPWNCDSISSSYDISIISQKTGYILKTKSGSKQCYNQYELISQLEFAITLLSQNILSKYIQIHASCIEKNGHGILFVGDHESGKSTLALTAISSGFKALTDDIAVLDINKRCVIGFPRPFKATENTFNIKPNIIPEDCPVFTVSKNDHYIFFHIPPEKYYSESTKIKYIIPIVRTEKSCGIRKLSEMETIKRIITQGFNFEKKIDTFVKDLVHLIKSVQSFELFYNNNWEAIKKIKKLLK